MSEPIDEATNCKRTPAQEFFAAFAAFPKPDPFYPSPFASGVAAELRDLAEQIESGVLTIAHFSATWDTETAKRRVEIEVV